MDRLGYMVGKKIDFQSGGYIFQFETYTLFKNITDIFLKKTYDNTYKVLKISINVDNELEIEEIISVENLIIEYFKSYNQNLLDFILKANDLTALNIKALMIRL